MGYIVVAIVLGVVTAMYVGSVTEDGSRGNPMTVMVLTVATLILLQMGACSLLGPS